MSRLVWSGFVVTVSFQRLCLIRSRHFGSGCVSTSAILATLDDRVGGLLGPEVGCLGLGCLASSDDLDLRFVGSQTRSVAGLLVLAARLVLHPLAEGREHTLQFGLAKLAAAVGVKAGDHHLQ